jgi:hypothetical protein
MTPVNLGDQLQNLNLLPVAAITSSSVSSAIDLQAIDGEIAVLLDVSAPVAGTNPGLAVKLTECATSGGSYTDVTGGGFTAAADTASAQKISLKKNELKQFVKLSYTISGTSSPQYLVSAKIVGINKYPA